MRYPDEIIDEIRERNDIVDVISSYIPLRQSSGSFVALCPFHNEKSPSFSVSPSKQMFYCFGCNTGGNVFTFIRMYENVEFIEAIEILAQRVNFILPEKKQSSPHAKNLKQTRETIAELNKRAARFFHEKLLADTPDAKNCRDYLIARGINKTIARRFGLGYAPNSWDELITELKDTPAPKLIEAGLASQSEKSKGIYDKFRGRLMFPILDSAGQVVGFGGRILGEGEPKYLNSPETPLFSKSKQLYGINRAKRPAAVAKEIFIVEGYTDVIAMHRAGYENTVGVLGTALTPDHARLIKRTGCESVTLILDSDAAGTRAATRAIPILLDASLRVKVLPLQNAKDPDEFIKTHGNDRFALAIKNATDHMTYRLNLLQQAHDLNEMTDRIKFTQAAAALISTLDSEIEKDANIKSLSKATQIAEKAIAAEINKTATPSQPTPITKTKKQPQNNITEAVKTLLYLITTYPPAATALYKSGKITPDDIGNPCHAKLLEITLQNAVINRFLPLEDIISRFEDINDQQQVQTIFTGKNPIEPTLAEKILNDTINIIKRATFLSKMQTTDPNELKKAMESLENTQKQYITINHG